MKGEVGGEVGKEAHTTAQPVSSDEMNDACSNVTVPGATCIQLNIYFLSCSG